MSFPKSISKRTWHGVVSLLMVLLVIIASIRAYRWYQTKQPLDVDIELVNLKISEIETHSVSRKQPTYNTKKEKYRVPIAKFDPNDYEINDWMLLGLSEKQAQVILRFKERTPIMNNEDLRQIFVINDVLFELLKDSTIYHQKKQIIDTKKYNKVHKKNKVIATINLNTATQDEILKLPGIGTYYAQKIIEYRQKLGGYTNIEQLLELYKFTPEKLEQLRAYIEITPHQIIQININTCTATLLAKHPYIDWNIANSIVKMRALNGEYTALDQLLKSPLINAELLQKIAPYLTIEQ